MAEFIILSEKEAALRQLETAINLYFKDYDEVSIHTLANASHELLAKICKKQGYRAFIGDEELDMIKPEKRNEYIKMTTKAKNFFKHGKERNNHEEMFKFYYESTDFIIWDACRLYQLINKYPSPIMVIFRMWFFPKYSNIIQDEEIRSKMKGLSFSSKKKFLDWLPPELTNKLEIAYGSL